MTDKLKQLIDEGVVGAETYRPRRTGGQVAGMPIMGYRLWMPKDADFPDIDIRIKDHRSQYQNKETCVALFELALNLE